MPHDGSAPVTLPGVTLEHLERLVAGVMEGVIFIDPAGVIVWANEAALRMHGAASVAALGLTVEEYAARFSLRYRNNHRLAARDYPMARTVAGEDFDSVVVVVRPTDDPHACWIHEVRNIVMLDADGEPDCLAIVLHDVTPRFEAEDRFEQAFNANPAPALIARLSDLRFVKVNRGFLEMTGYEREQISGRTVYQLDILGKADRAELAKERLVAGETIPQMEAELPLPGGQTKLVVLAGQPIDLADEPCMLFTFADLEPRRLAETSLRHSEERFAAAFRLAPVAMAVTALDTHRFLEVNAAFSEMTDYEAERIVGRRADDLALWERSDRRAELEASLRKDGGFRNCDGRIVTRGGGVIDCLISAETITVSHVQCVLWILHDITSRRHTERDLVTAIESVMRDAEGFSRSVMQKLADLSTASEGAASNTESLSKREKEVLGLICDGIDDRGISERLQLSPNTVRNHVARLYAKIGVNRRGAAIVWARETGFRAR